MVPLARRDTYVDSWRGAFHLVLLTDHLPLLFPGLFTLLVASYEALGYVSVAEGFVLLSGYITGVVYTRIGQQNGSRVLWRKALSRAFVIYATYVAAVMLLVLLVKWEGISSVAWGSWGQLFAAPLPSAAMQVAALLWQPSYLEILPIYSLFLIFAPAIIWCLDRRRHWLVVGISVLVWIAGQFHLRGKLLAAIGAENTVHLGFFDPFGWQILFVSALICGHRSFRAKGPWLPKGWALPLSAGVLAILLFALRHDLLGIQVDARWVERSSLGSLRLLNVACVFFLAARFRSYIEKWISWSGLALLSRYSLQVFAFHLIPVYAASLLIAGNTQLPWWSQLLFLGFCILGLFYTAWLSSLVKGLFLKRTATPPASASMEIVQPK